MRVCVCIISAVCDCDERENIEKEHSKWRRFNVRRNRNETKWCFSAYSRLASSAIQLRYVCVCVWHYRQRSPRSPHSQIPMCSSTKNLNGQHSRSSTNTNANPRPLRPNKILKIFSLVCTDSQYQFFCDKNEVFLSRIGKKLMKINDYRGK